MLKSIIISGPPAIGKTTIAKGLAKEFSIEYLSGGDILKKLASEQGFQTEGDDWWDTQEGMNFLNQRQKYSLTVNFAISRTCSTLRSSVSMILSNTDRSSPNSNPYNSL